MRSDPGSGVDPAPRQQQKRSMSESKIKTIGTLVSIVLLGLMAGCATESDLEALRQEVSKSQEMARAAEAKAEAARAEAQAAKAEAERAIAESRKAADSAAEAADKARTASEKADRIFRESLRK